MSDSPHDHEREALAWLRGRLPDRQPFHVWANFEFTTRNGQLYEVDALAITDNGFYLIEVKSHPGEIAGDSGTWQVTFPDGGFIQMNNPRILANRKAKALKSLLESTQAFRKNRRDMPYLEEVVFLSDPKLRSRISPQGRFNVFGRDADPGNDLPPERANLGGIVHHLTSLDPTPEGHPRRRIDRSVVDRLVKAVGQAGIRESTSRRWVGDYQVLKLLQDVEADSSTGIAYQDFQARHRSIESDVRRVRIYPLEQNATTAQREIASRAARREYELLRSLDHPSIVRPVSFTDHERGPALLFDYDPAEVDLAAFLANPASSMLSVDDRLGLIRQLGEALSFAHRHGVYHRALAPSAVLVTAGDEDTPPRIRITNWHAGARVSQGPDGTVVAGTAHAHVSAIAASDIDVYRAPEAAQPDAKPQRIDVFGLGALALLILTGKPPAASARQLRQTLDAVGYLDPTAVADAVDPELADLVIEATQADPSRRSASMDDVLIRLDFAEESWAEEELDYEPNPLDARRDAVIGRDRFKVIARLGRGATAIALLVEDVEHYHRRCVLKVAVDPETGNDRLLDEASSLEGLQHPAIVQLLEEPLDLSGHVSLLLSYAGPPYDPDRTTSSAQRTLATHLASTKVGVELVQRWGEDLLDALRYLEQMGRAHRDIKPDNLGVAPRGDKDAQHLVLFDFSLASASIEALEAGTPGYLDPFLAKRGRWDPAADRYSAAVTLFEIATGTKPRYGDGTADPRYVDDPVDVSPALFDSAVATSLSSFFARALHRDVRERFGTADEMYFAWRRAFEAAAEPATPTVHTDGHDEFNVPAGTDRATPLATLPLSRRAVSALENAEITTVGELLALRPGQLRALPGVGSKTRNDLLVAHSLLGDALGEEPDVDDTETTDDSASGQLSLPGYDEQRAGELGAVAAQAVPTSKRKDQQTQIALARIVAGLVPDHDPWASQAELGEWLDVTPARVSQLLGKLRARWLKEPAITRQRDQIRAEVTYLGVLSLEQLVTRLVVRHPGDDPALAAQAARGVIRIASLTEEGVDAPTWIIRRRSGSVLLARDGVDAPVSGVELANYAAALADAAGSLVSDHDVVTRVQLLDHLQSIAAPVFDAPLPDAHLADLAADLCAEASLNSRLELYRTDLEPVAALRATRRAFVAPKPLTIEDVQAKVAARFPAAMPLPGRPDLDAALGAAGVGLSWDSAAGAYINPLHRGTSSSTLAGSYSRYATNVTADIPRVEIDNAQDFEDRLGRSHNNGGLLVLVAKPIDVKKATSQLTRLADVTVSVDSWLTEQLDELTANGKPSWQVLTEADAAGEVGPHWGNLRNVVNRALDGFTQRLIATDGTVLLTDPGLLARFDRLDLVASWRSALHEGGNPLQALWLLVPAATATDVPMLDGRAVPVISRNEWSHLPEDWLRNAHRSGVAS